MTDKDDILQKTVRFLPEIARELKGRDEYGNLNRTINRQLERYFALLAGARRGLQGRFTEGELGFLLDIENGIAHEPFLCAENNVLFMEADDALVMNPGVYQKKWGFEKSELLLKLNGLTALEQAALIDCIERWWRATATGIPVAVGDLLKEKGE